MLLVVKRNDCDNQNQNEIVCYHSRRIHPSPPTLKWNGGQMTSYSRYISECFSFGITTIPPSHPTNKTHAFFRYMGVWIVDGWMDGWMNKWVASAVEIGNVMFQVSHSTTDQMTDGTMVVDFSPRFFWCFIFFAFPFPGEDENAENFSLFFSFCFFSNGFS